MCLRLAAPPARSRSCLRLNDASASGGGCPECADGQQIEGTGWWAAQVASSNKINAVVPAPLQNRPDAAVGCFAETGAVPAPLELSPDVGNFSGNFGRNLQALRPIAEAARLCEDEIIAAFAAQAPAEPSLQASGENLTLGTRGRIPLWVSKSSSGRWL